MALVSRGALTALAAMALAACVLTPILLQSVQQAAALMALLSRGALTLLASCVLAAVLLQALQQAAVLHSTGVLPVLAAMAQAAFLRQVVRHVWPQVSVPLKPLHPSKLLQLLQTLILTPSLAASP